MSHITPPNHTQIPNLILGDVLRGNIVSPGLMAELEGSQLKVLLAVCRLTLGFHQEQRRASLKMIGGFTGLSRPAIIDAAKVLESMGLIERLQDGGVTLWKIVVNSVNQEDEEIEPEVVNSVNHLVNSVNHLVNSVNPHLRKKPRKETRKETKEREKPRAPRKTPNQSKSNLPSTIPAFKVFVDITEFYGVTKYWCDQMERTVGGEPADLEKWKDVVIAWAGEGYKARNVKGQLEWFTNGIPKSRNGKNGHQKPETKRPEPDQPEWAKQYIDALS